MVLLGKGKHPVICINCESLYLYDKEDIETVEIPGLTKDLGVTFRYVRCPVCGYEHIV